MSELRSVSPTVTLVYVLVLFQENLAKLKSRPSATEVKPLATKCEPSSAILEPEWLVGDLLLGKVSGHPYWPCMVSYDPYESIYTRLIKRSK